MANGEQSDSHEKSGQKNLVELTKKDFKGLSATEVESLVHALQEQVKEVTEQNQKLKTEFAETRRWLVHSYEQEYSSLARNLHGGPIQELSSLLFDLNLLYEIVQEEDGRELVETLRENLKTAVRNLRRFIQELRPASLSHFGLQTAIRTYVENFQTEHEDIKIAFTFNSEERLEPPDAEPVLYRILQYTLENVVRHAQARNVLIRLNYQPEAARLEVEDDGIGFETEENWGDFARQDRLGLFLAREQARVLGGAVTVKSTPGKGTLVRTTIPLIIDG
jgi:two-component system, NarL family, sensor histidine kinase DegS